MIEVINITTNSSGAGSLTSNERVTGYINAVQVIYAGGLAGTTNVSLVEQTDAGLGRTIITRSATATNFVATPVQAGSLNDGTAVTNSFVPYYVSNCRLTVNVSSSSASITDAVIVRVVLSDYNY